MIMMCRADCPPCPLSGWNQVDHLKGIVIIVGNYGSGKTEVSINLAMHRKRQGADVRVADLDLVNPYFRTREARGVLAELGIEVVLPPERFMHADLPILTPAVAGLIRQPTGNLRNCPTLPDQLTVLDTGGDDVGATVLAALADPLRGKRVRMLQVVNPFRPFTESVAGCMKMRDEIEQASKMAVTGIIGNANLMDETTVADLYKGYDSVSAFSDASGLPLEFITMGTELLRQADLTYFPCPVLPIVRRLLPPWKISDH